jgi:PIN domain
MTGTDISTQRVLNAMVSLELKQRTEALDAAVKALQAQIERWSITGQFVVGDTSFYTEHEHKLEQADFRPLLGIWEDPVHLLVPITVIDELDGLKKSKDKHERWRARYTLAVLDRVFATSAGPSLLIPEDFTGLGSGELPRGQVNAEMVFDPPGHVRCRQPHDDRCPGQPRPVSNRDSLGRLVADGAGHLCAVQGMPRDRAEPAKRPPGQASRPGVPGHGLPG